MEYALPAKDDWSDFLKEKAVGKADKARKFSDVDVLMNRSEMVVRWVQSEIVSIAWFRVPFFFVC